MPLSIEELKARLAATKIKGQTGNFLRLDTDKPVVVHVLPGNDSLWFRQIGTHWLGKNRINCTNPDGEGSCYICDMVKQQKEELAEARKEHENDTPEEAAENAGIFNAVEEAIRRISSRRGFAMNVLVRGEEIPKTFEAPWMIFNTIYTMFNSAVNDYEIDITDPHESTPFTFLRTGKGKNGTRYSASPAPRGVPLFTGPEAEAKIAHLLNKMLDLDEQYKYPEKTELIAAWNTYTNGEEGVKPEAKAAAATAPPVRPAPPRSPPSMSRIGGKPVTTAKAAAPVKPPEPEPEPEPELGIAAEVNNGNGEEDPQEEPAPASVPTKHQATLASSKLLTRLKGKK
jgi:gp32 DNA binding protein like